MGTTLAHFKQLRTYSAIGYYIGQSKVGLTVVRGVQCIALICEAELSSGRKVRPNKFYKTTMSVKIQRQSIQYAIVQLHMNKERDRNDRDSYKREDARSVDA